MVHIHSDEQVLRNLGGPTTVYSCPIESCDWQHEQTVTADFSLLGQVPLAELGAHTARRAAEGLEAILREHLESHDVADFVGEIQRLRFALAEAKDDRA